MAITPPKESKLKVITVRYGEETFKFNLFRDLKISIHSIQKEISEQPSNYAFALLLHKKLVTRFMELKEERKSLGARLYMEAKNTLVSGRAPSDDYCNAKKESNKKYRMLTQACIISKDAADTLFALIKGFEQRKDLLQTISSNNRKQNEL